MNKRPNDNQQDESLKEQVLRSLKEGREKHEEKEASTQKRSTSNKAYEKEKLTANSATQKESNRPQEGKENSNPKDIKSSENQPKTRTLDSQREQAAQEPSRKKEKKSKKGLQELLKETETMSGSQKRRQLRKKENQIVRKIVTILVLVFILVLLIGGFSFWNFWENGQKPLNTKDTTTELVEIPLGSSNKQIGVILENNKIIKSALVFNYYMKLHNQSGFQAGFYDLAPNMTLDEIAGLLKEGKTNQQPLLIPEGYTIDQIAEAVEKNTPYTKEAFLKVVSDPEFFAEKLKEYPNLLTSASEAKDTRYPLEGYLFPATYTLTPGGEVKGLINQMLKKSDEVLSSYYEEIKGKNMTVQQVLTLASLVEKEGVKDDDRRNIAQVFYNRLAADMPLQSDISVLYALNEHKEKLSIEDTKVDSPYNLYQNKGYGPGPFNSPSEAAIKAVLYPQSNNYYYFVADISNGNVYFAQTFAEHEALVAQYVNK